MRAADLGIETNNAEWKTVVFDDAEQGVAVPNGSLGFRWNETGRWNLDLKDPDTGRTVEPRLTLAGVDDGWTAVDFPLFETRGASIRTQPVPYRNLDAIGGPLRVTTVFDLLAAHLGVARPESPETGPVAQWRRR